MPAADPHDLAIDQHEFEAEHVVGGQTVLQAMHTAGILGDIPTNAASDLAGRIGCVIIAVVVNRVADRKVGDPRLDHGAAIVVVDFQDAIEFAETEQNAILERQGAAGQRRPRATGHDLDAVVMAITQDAAHLRRGLRQNNDQRALAIRRQTIAFVGAQLFLLDDDALARHDVAQRSGDFILAVDDGRIGLRHFHGPALPLPRSPRG